ncbi:MAG: hypothetical protein HY011_23225 [Acidobacteria bacterium]|nr:hypothetical protein [Acidobacteriota bacterium]
MKRFYSLLLCASLFLSVAVASKAQMIANKKLSSSDLEAAQAEAKSAGGKDAQLVYATRLDAVQKGSFDSLVVIYATGKDTHALVVRGGKRYMLKADQGGQAVKAGDQFQRMGVRYEEGKAPVLRMFALNGGALRSVDFRFNGTEFVAQ